MFIDRDHIALTAMYISLTALTISVINAVVSWTLTARNNPLRNDNLRADEAAHADGVGVRLCCVNSIWILLTRDGKHLPPGWHIPLEDSLERIEMFLMGLSASSRRNSVGSRNARRICHWPASSPSRVRPAVCVSNCAIVVAAVSAWSPAT